MPARSCTMWFRGRSKMVDFLSVLFGLGAWLGINGIYTQLPLLVEKSPEGWQLPSIMVIVIQISNVGVIAVWILKAVSGESFSVSIYIYAVMSIGCMSMLLLSFFYGHTAYIGGRLHSVPFILLLFMISLGCCVSSVLYFPYMARFHEKYLVPYMVGEGLGGFLPAIISFGQNIGNTPTCEGGEAVYPPPFFGVQTFLLITFAFMLISLLAFALLDNPAFVLKGPRLSIHQPAYHDAVQERVYPERSISRTVRLADGAVVHKTEENEGRQDTANIASISTVKRLADVDEGMAPKSTVPEIKGVGTDRESVSSKDSEIPVLNPTLAIYLLVLQAFLCLITNAILPAVQSYTCLPYGNTIYHLSINLASMANPAACYLAFFLPHSSVMLVAILSVICVVTAGYLLALAIMSPFPPLAAAVVGGVIVVICWIVNSASASYAKLTIATLFRTRGARGLFLYGVANQVGSAIGSVLIFSLVHFTNVFQSYNPCAA